MWKACGTRGQPVSHDKSTSQTSQPARPARKRGQPGQPANQLDSLLASLPAWPASLSASQASLTVRSTSQEANWGICSSTSAESAEAFVRDMRRQGCRNWVTHNGNLLNLDDPCDIEGLSDSTLAQLVDEAATARTGPPIPLQPWEAEKLEAVAYQVTTALNQGRYTKDFGEVLLGQLGGWSGADKWAEEEVAWIESLVIADDRQSRDKLRQWIETSMISTLREIRKEMYRGHMAGTIDTVVSQSNEAEEVGMVRQTEPSMPASTTPSTAPLMGGVASLSTPSLSVHVAGFICECCKYRAPFWSY